MAKNKISEYSATSANNTDISNINIAEGCSPANVNNAIRTLMAQLKDQQDGTSGDPFTVSGALTASGTLTSSGTLAVTGGLTLDGSAGTSGQVLLSAGSGTPTWNTLGTMSSQNATAVAITGGTITGLSSALPVASGGTGATTSTGTGDTVRATSPTLVTPALGTPSAVVLTNATGTANSLNAGIGVNQTWTDVTASRAYGTTYTNSTGKPIAVSVSGTATGGGNGSFVHIVYVNGNEIAYQTTYAANAGYRHSVFFIVPNGATYSVTGTGGILSTTLYLWSELR